MAVVLACGAVACSGGGGSASSVSVPPRAPGEASAGSSSSAQPSSASSPAASGAPTAPGEVTAESLSDPDSGYVVVSVPEGLDEIQREVVVAYVAFDKATWRAYRAMDGDHSAVETTTGGDAIKDFQDDYAAWAAQGLHASGVYRVTIQTVNVDKASSNTAKIGRASCRERV